MQQDEFRTLAGFEEMSFDVADKKAAMVVSRHRVSQTYLKFSVGYGLAESKKTDSRKACRATSKGRKVRRNGIFSLRSWRLGARKCLAVVLSNISNERIYKKATPPSTATVCPVMKSLSGEERNSTVPSRSLGSCTRFNARSPTLAERILMISSLGLSSDRVEPGAMALTLMLSSPTSRARQRVKPMTPALEVT